MIIDNQLSLEFSNASRDYKNHATIQYEQSTVGIDYEYLRKTFKKKCNDYYDFLMIDMTKDTPYRIRKNVYEVLDYDSDEY